MAFDLYIWDKPRDFDADEAGRRIEAWLAAGADPVASPFERSENVGWFVRELRGDVPDLDYVSDAQPSGSRTPIWLAPDPDPPARIVAIRLPPEHGRDALESILGLATKYDLVVFEPTAGRLFEPLAALGEHASATFWPAGAIRAAVAGLAGAASAAIAWLLGIPILSGVVAVAGGFMAVMAVFTFAVEGRAALRRRRP